jgi:ABC-type Fe3+-siderophore transport system permease subunit
MQTFANSALMLGAAILGIAALWHFYWAMGGRAGLVVAIPEKNNRPLFTPSRLATAAVAFGIASIAVLYAAVAFSDLQNSPSATFALGVCSLVFVGRAVGDFGYVGFFKSHTGTAFAKADNRFYSPLCLFLGIAGLSAAAPTIIQLIG